VSLTQGRGGGRGDTLSHRVYEQVRDAILRGRLQPGQRLRVASLCSEYQVSLNVVREALSRLTGEGLVRSTPQVGFTVFEPSREDLADLADLRIEIEGLALRWSIERGDVAWESRVVAAHHQLLRQTPAGVSDEESVRPSETWMSAHAEFHRALLGGTGSKRLTGMTRALSDGTQIYRRWYLGRRIDAERDLAAEHAQLAELAVSRHKDEAVSALASHIIETRDHLLAHESTTTAHRSTGE